MSRFCVGLCTCPDSDTARNLAQQLIEQRLAACVNIIPAVESVYRWQDAIQTDLESQLVVKTHSDKLDDIKRLLEAQHPYDEPEWIVLDITSGSDTYLHWIARSLDEI